MLPSPAAALRELAGDGISVLVTIHSPPPETFALFHRFMVLQKGRVVYFGDNGGWAPGCLLHRLARVDFILLSVWFSATGFQHLTGL